MLKIEFPTVATQCLCDRHASEIHQSKFHENVLTEWAYSRRSKPDSHGTETLHKPTWMEL